MAAFTDTPRLSNRYADALAFAFSAHHLQIRKQGEVPYIAHLLAVSSLVLEAGGSEDEAIVGLLHDYLEDINPKQGFNVLADRFSLLIASMVNNLSADSNEEYIEKMGDCEVMRRGDSMLLVSCADKLHNLRSYSTDGRHLWKPAHAEFYPQLMPIYAGCDRIPRHWIEEMRENLKKMN